MSHRKPTVDRLKTRMKEAEALVRALRTHQVDAIVGEREVSFVRLKQVELELESSRDHLSPYAPRIEKLMVNPEKIGAIIGKGGETINKITKETGAEVDIKDDGLVTVSAVNTEAIEKALNWIKSLVEEPEVGKIYEGKVVSIKDFGAFINIMPGIDGMCHISAMSDKRIEKVTDVVSEGQVVKVRLMAIDDRGRLSLSMRPADLGE